MIPTAHRFTEKGRFIALYGQEFSTIGGGNHMNVLDAPHVISFLTGCALRPGESVTVTSGPTAAAGAGFLRGTGQSIWSNAPGHPGRLIDVDGNIVAEDE